MKTDRAEGELPERIRPELDVEKWSIWRPANSRGGPRARTFERDVLVPDGTRIVARLKVAPTTEGSLTTEQVMPAMQPERNGATQPAVPMERAGRRPHGFGPWIR